MNEPYNNKWMRRRGEFVVSKVTNYTDGEKDSSMPLNGRNKEAADEVTRP